MPERLWGIRMQSRGGAVDEWVGYWETRAEAAAYVAKHAHTDTGHNQGELASMHADWLTVEPIEWVGGRDTNLKVKNRPWPTANGSQRIAGGPDG